MFEFSLPWVFLLLPLPFIIYRFLPKASQAPEQKNAAVIVPFYQQVSKTTQYEKQKTKKNILRAGLLSFLWCLLIISAAKPQWVGNPQATEEQGRNLLLAVDISRSMKEQDMQIGGRAVSRLSAVKHVVSDFIHNRQGDRIGLVLFGTQAYLQTPLTFDTHSVEQFLQEAQRGFAGPKTAIGDAIGLSVKRLKDQNKQTGNDARKVIILLTDGENTAGEVEPLQAAELAAKLNTTIYTIGIGADDMVIKGLFGNHHINPSAALDEKTLITIAKLTQGRYFRARNIEELNTIYQELDRLEPTSGDEQWLRPVQSLFMWPLALCLLLTMSWAAWFFLNNTLLKKLKNNYFQEGMQ